MAITPVHVVGRDIDETWFLLLSELWKHSRKNRIDSGSYEGSNRLEFDYAGGMIMRPTNRPLAPIVPEGVAPPTTDEKIEVYFLNHLLNPELAPNEHYKYATWIAGGGGRPHQFEWCINHYLERGFGTNHCFIQVGDPDSNLAYDKPYKNETERGTSPCLRGIDTKIVEDEGKHVLLMNVYFRSWDLWGGFPENMGGMVRLMETMSEALDVKPGTLSFASKGLHAYDFQLEQVKTRLNID